MWPLTRVVVVVALIEQTQVHTNALREIVSHMRDLGLASGIDPYQAKSAAEAAAAAAAASAASAAAATTSVHTPPPSSFARSHNSNTNNTNYGELHELFSMVPSSARAMITPPGAKSGSSSSAQPPRMSAIKTASDPALAQGVVGHALVAPPAAGGAGEGAGAGAPAPAAATVVVSPIYDKQRQTAAAAAAAQAAAEEEAAPSQTQAAAMAMAARRDSAGALDVDSLFAAVDAALAADGGIMEEATVVGEGAAHAPHPDQFTQASRHHSQPIPIRSPAITGRGRFYSVTEEEGHGAAVKLLGPALGTPNFS